jgi:hypothetical protein
MSLSRWTTTTTNKIFQLFLSFSILLLISLKNTNFYSHVCAICVIRLVCSNQRNKMESYKNILQSRFMLFTRATVASNIIHMEISYRLLVFFSFTRRNYNNEMKIFCHKFLIPFFDGSHTKIETKPSRFS